MLELVDLSKSYGGRSVLAALSHRFEPGEFVAIMGESGVGKSTLLNLIAGLDTPDAGQVVLDGTPISTLDDDAATRLRRARIGFIFQAFHVLPHLTLQQNVALPLLLNGQPAGRAEAMLAAVGLGGRGADYPRQLSGGELQRVAIARALVHRPALLLADEPTGNLDPDTASRVIHLLRECAKIYEATVLLATHSRMAASAADRVLALSQDGVTPVHW